jgi:hypothetical protein
MTDLKDKHNEEIRHYGQTLNSCLFYIQLVLNF